MTYNSTSIFHWFFPRHHTACSSWLEKDEGPSLKREEAKALTVVLVSSHRSIPNLISPRVMINAQESIKERPKSNQTPKSLEMQMGAFSVLLLSRCSQIYTGVIDFTTDWTHVASANIVLWKRVDLRNWSTAQESSSARAWYTMYVDEKNCIVLQIPLASFLQSKTCHLWPLAKSMDESFLLRYCGDGW